MTTSRTATEVQTKPVIKPRERAPKPIAAGVDIGHVHLKTADIDRIHGFYVGVLGFDVVVRMPDALFLSAGGYHHHLGFNTWESKGGSPPPPGTTGLYHVAIRYPTRAALGDALRRLVEAGWPLDGVNDHGTHEALYLRDPDGNGLELAWDRPESEWPTDAEGHLSFSGRRLDLQGLLAEGAQD
jgi:catechol 2,3-dioxygenase